MRDSRPDNAFLRGTPSHDVLSPHLAQGALENVAATNFRDPRMCAKHESNLPGSWRIQSSYHSRWREPSRQFMWNMCAYLASYAVFHAPLKCCARKWTEDHVSRLNTGYSTSPARYFISTPRHIPRAKPRNKEFAKFEHSRAKTCKRVGRHFSSACLPFRNVG